MPTSKKPRKKYVPKPKLNNPVGFVLNGMTRMTEDEHAQVDVRNRLDFEALLQGRGSLVQWNRVTAALNMAAVISETFFDFAYLDEITAAQAAHARCGARHFVGRNFGYSGPDLQVVKFAFEVHAEQLQALTFKEIDTAMRVVAERSRQNQFTMSARKAIPEIAPP